MELLKSKLYLKDIGKRAYTTSRLLVPADLMNYYSERCEEFGGRAAYLDHLVQVYGRHLSYYCRFPYTAKWKKKYQSRGLDLEKCDFVPDPNTWEELRHIGFAYGLAMCKLFVLLLALEKRRWEEAGSPETFREKAPTPSQKRRRQRKNRKKKRNSVRLGSKLPQITTDNLLFGMHSTNLGRILDRNEESLLRIGWYSE